MADGLNIQEPLEDAVPQTPEETEVEYIVEDEGETQKTAEDFEAKLAELAKQNEELTQRLQEKAQAAPTDTNAQLAAALEKLASAQAPKKEEEPQGQQFDMNAHLAKIKDNFFNDPAKSTVEAVAPILQEITDKFSRESQKQQMTIGKLMLLNDPNEAQMYAKYKDEVEAMVQSLPAGQDTYQKALGAVKSRHIDEIIEERTTSALEKLVEEKLKEQGVAQQSAGQERFTNAGMVAAPAAPAKKQVKISANMAKIGPQYALTKGLDWDDAGDKEIIIEALKARGIK